MAGESGLVLAFAYDLSFIGRKVSLFKTRIGLSVVFLENDIYV